GRRLVVVGDGASLGVPVADRAGGAGGGAAGVIGRAAVAAGGRGGVRVRAEGRRGGHGAREARTRLHIRGATGDAHREAGCARLAAVVVDHVLDHDQGRRLVVVGDGASLHVPDAQRPGAVSGGAAGVTGRATLADGVRAGVQM